MLELGRLTAVARRGATFRPRRVPGMCTHHRVLGEPNVRCRARTTWIRVTAAAKSHVVQADYLLSGHAAVARRPNRRMLTGRWSIGDVRPVGSPVTSEAERSRGSTRNVRVIAHELNSTIVRPPSCDSRPSLGPRVWGSSAPEDARNRVGGRGGFRFARPSVGRDTRRHDAVRAATLVRDADLPADRAAGPRDSSLADTSVRANACRRWVPWPRIRGSTA